VGGLKGARNPTEEETEMLFKTLMAAALGLLSYSFGKSERLPVPIALLAADKAVDLCDECLQG
jgi:hypothetical protein